MAIIYGTSGDDTLITSRRGDILLGREGNDTLEARHGFNILFGGEGDDLLTAFSSFNILSGGVGNDYLWALGSWNLLAGGDGDDWLYSASDNNTLNGGSGNDVLQVAFGSGNVLNGGDGNDLLLGGVGNDTLQGGAGEDTVNYAATTLGVTVDLTAGTATGTEIGTDALSGIERVIGGQGNDSLSGDANDNVLEGGGGNDTLSGGAGDDVLNGGVIADLQSYAAWTDFDRVDYSAAPAPVNVNLGTRIALDGEAGTDTLIGIENVTGSAFDDQLIGTATTFSEAFRGGAGNDTINGGGLYDIAEYYFATGPISVNLGTGSVTGDASVGTDTLTEIETVIGTAFDDNFVATGFQSPSAPGGVVSTFNSFEGRGGNDHITGNGATRIEYSSALEAVTVDLMTELMSGGPSVGTDTFTGVNNVRGSGFADTLYGGNPASNGFETFEGRGGDDFIDGRSGFDRADYAYVGAVTAGLTVNLAMGTATGDAALVGSDTLRSIESIRGSYLADTFDAMGFSSISLNAGSFGTFNEFEGMAGNDTFTGNGNTRISYISALDAVNVNLAAGTAAGGASIGTDTFSGVNAARGSNFSDTLTGSGSSNTLDGQAGNDTLIGLGGNDTLLGGEGNDAMSGGEGNDTLDAGNGLDTLTGGIGFDILRSSGSGTDIFDYNAISEAGDTVEQFTAGAGGDIFDIADLLDASTNYTDGSGGPLADYVQIVAAGTNGLLQIDTDGASGLADWQTLATILGGSTINSDMFIAGGNIDILN
jgi:Ca2+-binding RTX toxin-like protein